MNEETLNNTEVTSEEAKLLLENEVFLQYAVKIMNDIPLDDESEVDYMELWNKIALQKKLDPGEVSSDGIVFYYQLLSTGLENFGASFIRHMGSKENVAFLAYGIKCLLAAMADYSEDNDDEKPDTSDSK